MADDQTTAEQASQARKGKARLAREVAANDLKWLMGNRQGRRFVWSLLERAGVYQTSFTGNDAQTNFKEGMRNVGLMLIADLHTHTPGTYAQMLTESKAPE